MRECTKRALRKYYGKLRTQMFLAYGTECSCCGESKREFLTLEHLNGSGKEHRLKVGGGYQAILDLRKRGWPKEGYTILCMNCNWGKRFSGVCPHKIIQEELPIH